jgi:histone deacetylase 11
MAIAHTIGKLSTTVIGTIAGITNAPREVKTNLLIWNESAMVPAMKNKLTRRQMLLALSALFAGGLGLILTDELSEEIAAATKLSAYPKLVPLIWNRHYDVTAFGLERLHPFDGRKFSKIQKKLLQSGLRRKSDFTSPSALTREQLQVIHTTRYLDSLTDSHELSDILEVGLLAKMPSELLDWRILRPMRLASGGTLLSCRKALEHGVAINIGGGFHHAERDQGGGFCVYSDVPIALSILRAEKLIKRAMIVDTDAHQGNGFANVARSDPFFYILDLFDESIYPYPKVDEDWSIPFRAYTNGDKYLGSLEGALPEAIKKAQPDLIVYNAGSDVLKSDPLSTFQLSPQHMNERDIFVVSTARQHNIPIAMVLAGGYSTESADAHAQSIKLIVEKYDRS